MFEASNEVFLILTGEVAVTVEMRKVYTKEILQESTLAVLKPGISFGELGVLYQTPR